MADAYRDSNSVPTLIASSNVDGFTPVRLYADPVTHRLLIDSAAGGSGTVTSVSVATANGFSGTVATPTTTPAITLSTTITGVLKGNGTAISAAVANTDYQSPIALTTTGSSGAATFNGTTLNIPQYSGGASGITIGTTTITSGTTTRILYNNAGVVGEYTLTGSGTVAVMQNTPTLTTPVLGVATATSINKVAITAPATSATLTIADGKTLTVSNSLTLAGTDGKGINVGVATSGKILVGDGTDMILSTPTFPNASATSGKIIKSDGTNWVASTETYAVPGTSGNVMTSNGTNWTSAAPSSGGADTSLSNLVANPVINVATVTLSSAQIQALAATPITAIAAPGAGKVIVVDSAVFYFIYGTVAYTVGGNVILAWSGGTTSAFSTNLIGATSMRGAANILNNNFETTAQININARINTGIVITHPSAEYATGDGTAKVFIRYRVITL